MKSYPLEKMLRSWTLGARTAILIGGLAANMACQRGPQKGSTQAAPPVEKPAIITLYNAAGTPIRQWKGWGIVFHTMPRCSEGGILFRDAETGRMVQVVGTVVSEEQEAQ